MFGYVKAYAPELKVKEYELYRAAYCGVCRSMGECTGTCSRLSLTWDSVFLFFLRTALTRDCFESRPARCIVHPLRRRAMLSASPQLDYSARASAVLVYHKLRDDLKDERGIKRFLARVALPFAAAARRRADLPELCATVESGLARLNELEKSETASFDAPADISASLTAEVFAFGLEPESAAARIAREIGYHTGKFIYAADAADDFAEDVKRRRFNPYHALFGHDTLTDADRAVISDAVKCEAGAIVSALNLIDFDGINGIKSILYNIVLEGMYNMAEDTKTAGKTAKGKKAK